MGAIFVWPHYEICTYKYYHYLQNMVNIIWYIMKNKQMHCEQNENMQYTTSVIHIFELNKCAY